MIARRGSRTAERPMAFSRWEFARGAIAALLAFHILFLPVASVSGLLLAGFDALMVVLLTVAAVQLLFVLGASVAAALIGGAAAYGLGRVLEGVSAVRVHLAAFAALGLLVGVLTLFGVSAWPKSADDFFGHLLGQVWHPVIAVPLLLLSAFAVASGWRWTATRALRSDLEGSRAAAASTQPDAAL